MDLPRHAERYLDYLAVERGLSTHSLAAYRRDLALYGAYLVDRGIDSPTDAARQDLAEFVAWIRERRTKADKRYAASTIARVLVAVRGMHRFLVTEGLSLGDPSVEISAPRPGRRLPKALRQEEVEALLAVPGSDDPVALRDRAMLELLYAAGLRISELIGLDLDDLDVETRTVEFRAKGRKERVVPVGRTAIAAVEAWLVRGRPAMRPQEPALFCNQRGHRLTRQGAWKIVRAHARTAGLVDRVSPHTLRHSYATHLLDGGADVRVVQELLGHASVNTTQIYTQVTEQRVRAAYDAAHPRARAEEPRARQGAGHDT